MTLIINTNIIVVLCTVFCYCGNLLHQAGCHPSPRRAAERLRNSLAPKENSRGHRGIVGSTADRWDDADEVYLLYSTDQA